MKALALPLRRPVGTAALYAALLLLAVYAVHDLPLSLAPDLDEPELVVRLAWPNATPETMEALVTAPLEAEAERLRGVTHVASASGLGWAEITLEFEPGTRMDRAEVLLRERLATMRETLPPDLLPPEVVTTRSDTDAGGRFFLLRAGGPRTPEALRGLMEDRVAPRLAAVAGVSSVGVYGGGEREIHVDVDHRAVARGQVTPGAVAAALDGVGGARSAGALVQGGARLPVVLVQPEPRAEVVRGRPVGGDALRPLSVGEVAQVGDGWRDPRRLARVDGHPAVQVVLERAPGTNVLRVARAVRAALDDLRAQLPPDVGVETLYDQSERIQEELAALARRSSACVVAVFGVLVLALGRWRAPLAVLVAVLCSALLTFLLFRAAGLGIDLVTLAGLALAFGMAVDSSIVILQSLAAHGRRLAIPAVVAAVRQVLLPLFAGTLTTAVVMVPFLYLSGDLRTYYLPFVLAVCLSLLASFFVGVTLTPLLGRGALSGRGPARPEFRLLRRAVAWLPPIERLYAPLLDAALRRPLVPVAVALVLFAASLWVWQARIGRGSLFGSDADTGIRVAVRLPRGAEVERTDALLQRFERLALEHPFRARGWIRQVQAFVLESRGMLDIRFDPAIAVTAVPASVQEELVAEAAAISGAEVNVSGYGPGFSSSRAHTSPSFQLTLRGPDYLELGRIAADLGRRLDREPRVREIDTNAADFTVEQATDLALVPDRDRLARTGLRMADLVAGLQPAIAGELGDRVLPGPDGDVSARIRFEDGAALTREALLATSLRNPAGVAVPLAELVRVDERPILPEIRRDRQQYERRVTFDYRGPRPVANAFLRSFMAGTTMPPGYTLEDGLGLFLTRREQLDLGVALGLAFVLVYMVAAALFESLRLPFVALLALPLGFVGVAAAFWATGTSFDRAAYVGLILLTGIAVNSSLLLVHRAGSLLRRGLERTAAVRRAALERCRPIAMTTTTSVAGLLPLALSSDAGTADTWRGLALAACSGLAAAALATLVVVPALVLVVVPRRKSAPVPSPWFASPSLQKGPS
jgi:multidrug efflux pump subunit AcrB